MDLRLTDEQQQLVESIRRLFADHVTPDRVRETEALGFDPVLWAALVEFGIASMAVPADAGGWGASLLELAFVADEAGRVLAPAPIVETIVATRLLARLGGARPAELLDAVVSGGRQVTLAVHPVRGSRASLVPAAAVADLALARRGHELVVVTLEGRRWPASNLGAMPLADVDVDGADVLASGSEVARVFDAAVDEWLTLTAAALVGLAARALEIGVRYAVDRKAWGQPIGAFQAIAHPFADSATAIDGARLLTYEAAWAAADRPERHAELASMAFAFAAETARDVTYRSLHAHGGYGFMLEYDIQLYFRRARAWANVFAEPAKVYERAAVRLLGLEAAAPV